MHIIRHNMKSRKRMSGVCGQDFDVTYGPILTKFVT